ncbi:MAG: hypothetical protein ACI37S_02940 [Candidatus Gastranaerophilaceae bacterium]
MNKHFRIIDVNGFRGLLLFCFIVICLLSGFLVFPGFLAMFLWNTFIPSLVALPTINLFQGILLWAIIAFAIYMFSNHRVVIIMQSRQKLYKD